MKKILSSTAFVAGIAFGGAAFAQAATSESLLDLILADVNDLSASLSNVSQNLNSVDGSITVDTTRDYANFDEVIDSLLTGTNGFGSYSQVSSTVFGSDVPASLLNVLNPLTLELGNLSTTAIGTLQSGNMTATFDASGLLATAESTSTGLSTSAGIMAEQYGSIALPIAMQNISVNSGAIDGSIALTMADVNATIGNVGTTAIGALGSGALTANVKGTMGAADATATTLVSSLVGGSTTTTTNP